MDVVSPTFSDLLTPNVEIKEFPDGDSYVRIPNLESFRDQKVVLYHRLYPEQNTRIFELILMLKLLKSVNASITLVAPYLPYSRQDKVWLEGEVKSAEVLANLLADLGVDRLVTFDCHFLKKEGDYEYGGLKITNISMNKKLIEYASKKLANEDFEVISPDEGARYLVEEFGGESMKKMRGDYVEGEKAYRRIEKLEFKKDLTGKNVVIIDDMISTGGTMIKAVDNVKKHGAKKVVVCTTHGFFLKDSLFKLQTKADFVFSSNTIISPVSEVDFMPLLSDVL